MERFKIRNDIDHRKLFNKGMNAVESVEANLHIFTNINRMGQLRH